MTLQVRNVQTGEVSFIDPKRQKEVLPAHDYYDWLYDRTEDLDEIREANIAKLKVDCTKAIYAGFESVSTGYSFGFNDLDQINFTQRMLTIVAGAPGPFLWKALSGEVVSLTKDEFMILVYEAETHKLVHQSKYWELEKKVIAARLKHTIDAIKW